MHCNKAKTPMKTNSSRIRRSLAVVTFLAGAHLSLATPDLYINTYDSATQGNIGREWGPGSAVWDATQGNSAGAMLVTCVFSGSSDTPSTAYSCLGQYANPWYVQTPINVSSYRSLQFDIKYDTTSDITIDQFNDPGTWPTTLTNSLGQPVFQSWAGAGYLSGSIRGLEITLCGGPAGQMAPTIIMTNIPAAAANGWAHVVIPINQSQGNIDGVSGIVFHKWIKQNWGILNDATARFWIDNLMLEGTNAPPPPPSLSLGKAAPGLNLIAGLNSDPNTRYNIRTVQTTTGANYSWVGNGSTPVSYSFTVAQHPGPDHPYFMINQYLIPVPYDRVEGTNGTIGTGSAPDWDQATCIFMDLENYNDGSADWRFRYKTNSPGGNGTFYSDVLAELRDHAGITGTWTITFVNNTNVTMTSPHGLTTNFVFSADKAAYFADTNGVALPMYHYVGARANGSGNYGLCSVLSRVQIQGSPSTLDDNFLSETSLDTTLWELASASNPSIQLVPASPAPVYWLNWTLPDAGFALQKSLSASGTWADQALTPLTVAPGKKTLITAADLPAAQQGYWRLIKRPASQLQILLPGETQAPGTLTGKTGTPDAQYLGSVFYVTVNAVDSEFHTVKSVTDVVHLSCTDASGYVAPDTALNNGTASFQVTLNTAGTWSYTATDVTTNTISAGTSATITPQ
jgi:hypothetical protein